MTGTVRIIADDAVTVDLSRANAGRRMTAAWEDIWGDC